MDDYIIEQVMQKILSYSYGNNEQILKKVLYDNISKKYFEKEELKFIMPSFPGKSPNNNSCFSWLPDYTEYISIETIIEFVDSIRKVYPYGCEFTIIHDGHFFYNLNITRSEEELNEYILSLKKLFCQKIKSFTIYDLMGSNNLQTAYSIFKNKYFDENMSIENLSNEILFTKNEFSSKLFTNNLSNNKKQKIATDIARRSILIKKSISYMIKDIFPDYIRLSVHFQNENSEKMGLKLIPLAINKGTPWFYIAYVSETGKILLGKKNWNFESKNICYNEYGKFFSISDNDIFLFENGLADKKIIRERRYNR